MIKDKEKYSMGPVVENIALKEASSGPLQPKIPGP